jgi:hypothetical protein
LDIKPYRRGVCIALALLCLVACAGPGDYYGSRSLRKQIDTQFKAADTDKDEWLTPVEFEAGLPSLAGKFKDVDTDHNSKVNLAELRSYVELMLLSVEPPQRRRK